MKKVFKISVLTLLSLMVFSLVFLYVIYRQVSEHAATQIDRGAIERIIFSESPVYYDDGKTPIGVYFDKTHSKYIRYEDIPRVYVKALIASEDRGFFTHWGFDLKAIARAFIVNLRAGKVIQGGSTITQQTAKNIFERQTRTYTAKLRELIQALLLETKYTKEEIIEMYVNQFFVTGIGKGLRIAAEYFFDKRAEDLDLVESAFIAGSVKGPNRYNPFTKKTETERNDTMNAARLRKDYVIKNMYLLNLITKEEYEEARRREVPFKEGRITYSLNVILDYIREQLESDYFREILERQGVDNLATSGIRIYTSIDKEIQDGALEALRKHLPLLDVQLTGYEAGQLKEGYENLSDAMTKRPETNLPFLCRITHINREKDDAYLMVSWEGGGGIVDYDGLKVMGEAWLKWKLGPWAVFDNRHVLDFLKNFETGDLVPVRYGPIPEADGQRRLMLTKIPSLEGGIIVLGKGMIKAMVGGFFNHFFNRAADAKRQLGSIFKPLVYTAALKLKWNTLDPLTNMRDLFQFETTSYLPKPDHEPESTKVSMAWAGTKSENLATVWLLYHLTDRLNPGEFREVVDALGLQRNADESYQDYVTRIRDVRGVVVDRAALMEAAFEESKKEIESDLIFSGLERSIDNLRRIHFDIDAGALNLGDPKESEISMLDFQRLQSLNSEMKRELQRIHPLKEGHAAEGNPDLSGTLAEALSHFFVLEKSGAGPRIIYSKGMPRESSSDLRRITPEWMLDRTHSLNGKEIEIEGLLPSEAIDLLQLNLTRVYKRLLPLKRYDQEVLYRTRDFKTLVNLLYVNKLAGEMGISTRLDPVLSFPLGGNSVSILEAALAYHTMMSGGISRIKEGTGSDMAPIITRIEDRQGDTIWEYRPQPEEILTKHVSGPLKEILRMVVVSGTGRKARDAVQLSMAFENGRFDVPIPSFGKTGTSNEFTNSSFAGFVPRLQEQTGEFDTDDGYVLATYVGYDDNRPMKGRNVTIYGASGALPLWIDVANTVVNSQGYKKNVQVADLVFDMPSASMMHREGLQAVKISPVSGLPMPDEKGQAEENRLQLYGAAEFKEGVLDLNRIFEPN